MDPDGSTPVPENLRFEAIGSTNDLMLRISREGVEEHTSLIAREQTNARTGPNKWHAPPGGLWLSTLWEPTLDISATARLPLAALWGVREGIRETTGIEPGLKWPNDLIIDHAKLGSVTIDARVGTKSIEEVALGVLVNANNPAHALPDPIAQAATSLQGILSRPVDLDALATNVHGALKDARHLLEDPAELVRLFESCWTQKGREVHLSDGYRIFEGEAKRIDEKGRLVLASDEGDENPVDDPRLAKVVRIVE